MKLSKLSLVILLILFAIIGFEIYYHKGQISDVQNSKKAIIKSLEANASLVKEEEDKKILDTVESYQKGYKEGCKKAIDKKTVNKRTIDQNISKKSMSVPSVQTDDRAYHLGLEKGEEICRAELKRKKALYEKGYKDGCSSAVKTLTKDKKFYDSSGSYRKGWDVGKKSCGKKEVSKEKKSPKREVNRKSPDYQRGYLHGCNSAHGMHHRIENVYLHNREYRSGWTEGREKCQLKKKALRSPQPHRDYFKQGYRDGCDTATRYYKRDRYKYDHETSYRKGWKTGERECSRERIYQEYPMPMIPMQPFSPF
ncbi:MAG: hypothetical protein U9Q90_03885 [Campylobacterota bacterium]|nr:hypothetical protein [Campylobacterota bacterium]